jgi:putative ABC transport system permease protein
MPRLWRLVTGTWWTNPGRTIAAILSVALGVGTVVLTTNVHETAFRAVTGQVMTRWLGAAHLSVHPAGAHWGSLDASLADAIRGVDNVRHVTVRLRRHVRCLLGEDAGQLLDARWSWVDAVGIEPETERLFRTPPNLRGRMLHAGERGAAVMEIETAGTWGVGLGDRITLAAQQGGARLDLELVGLFDSQRVADFQRPTVYVALTDLQALKDEAGSVSAIDIMLYDTSASALADSKAAVEHTIVEQRWPYPVQVESAAARQLLLDEAKRITHLLELLVAFIAMLTSFFIILTTQSISLQVRRRELGMMRCVGLTRAQLAGLLLGELTALGLAGTLVGVAGGVALTYGLAAQVEDVVYQVFLSRWGIGLAIGSGLVTTWLTALFLIVQIGAVGPLEAAHPQARPARLRFIPLAGVIGVALVGLHHAMVTTPDRTQWLDSAFASVGTGSVYLGYALITPVVVVWLGRPVARLVGRLLGLRATLAEGPFLRTPWRTTGACWVLMVGLSLIIFIAVRAEGVLAVWDFPARLPETFVWSPRYVSSEDVERVRRLPGVGACTVTADVDCEIRGAGETDSLEQSLVERFLRKLSRPVFVAGDPDTLLSMMKVVFTEGDRDEAIAKVKRGGYVIIPPQTARNKGLHAGDRVAIRIGERSAVFEVAGVVQSPALDLAVTAFQAESYMQLAAASAVLGTREDLRERFGLDLASMLMCDLELPPSAVPPTFNPSDPPRFTQDEDVARTILAWEPSLPGEREMLDRIGRALRQWSEHPKAHPLPDEIRPDLRRFGRALQYLAWSSRRTHRTREQDWDVFRERLMLLKMAEAMGRPDAIIGSLRRLKQEVDAHLKRAIVLITWLPSVILFVAAVGIGNLMTVSVHMRSRELAVLRAVGAHRSQIIRLILAEAVTIGLLGSVISVALGCHLAYSDNRVGEALIDVSLEFIVPVATVALSVGLTVAVCLLAGVRPARRAARSDIIAVMQTT